VATMGAEHAVRRRPGRGEVDLSRPMRRRRRGTPDIGERRQTQVVEAGGSVMLPERWWRGWYLTERTLVLERSGGTRWIARMRHRAARKSR
jgi:hypothetical protein